MSWNYQREEREFEQVPVGKHRIRILGVELTQSKSSGNDMLAFQFEVSGMNNILYYYIPFLNENEERRKITNRMLTNFYDSFKDIPEGSTDLISWVGKVGACVVKVDKNDEDRTRLSYFIEAEKQGDLPPWKEPENSASRQSTSAPAGFGGMQTNDIPF